MGAVIKWQIGEWQVARRLHLTGPEGPPSSVIASTADLPLELASGGHAVQPTPDPPPRPSAPTTRGVPKQSRTCGRAAGILIGSLLLSRHDLSAQSARRAGPCAVPQPTEGAREVTPR